MCQLPCVKCDQRINIVHFLGNLSWIIFYPRWIMQFWINIPVSYTRPKVGNVIVKMSQTNYCLFKCLSILKFCNLLWRTLPLFYECAQPCMNAIIFILYRHDRQLSSTYFDMQFVNLCKIFMWNIWTSMSVKLLFWTSVYYTGCANKMLTLFGKQILQLFKLKRQVTFQWLCRAGTNVIYLIKIRNS